MELMKIKEAAHGLMSDKEFGDVLSHTRRKLILNGKDESYFAVLLENEISDFMMRRNINALSEAMEEKKCARFAT